MKAECPRVALLIETSRGYGRLMLRGIMRYARLHGPWSFYVTPGDFEQALPKMSQWGGSGIIARVATPEIAKGILAADVPTVLVGVDPRIVDKVPRLAKLCEISSDSEGAARLAAEHLLARGFRSFAYVGIWDRGWSERRESASPADLNLDGAVDLTDYGILSDHLKQSVASNADGDMNGDGVVNYFDFHLWKSIYHASTGGGGSSVSNVPEPSPWLLTLALGTAMGLIGGLQRSRT